LLDPAAERLEMSVDGGELVGNLRRPAGVERPPLVILVPGLDSTNEEFFNFELLFLARGLATLSLDGPGQGEGGFALPIRHDYEVAVATALDRLDGRDDLELNGVGAAGVSLGGYYAPRAAAFEPRIKAVASVSGPRNFGELWDELPMLTREAFAHYSRSPDAETARERAGRLDLAGVAERIEQPMLVITGKLDRLIPWRSSERIADEAPNSTFILYEEGNHVCNNVAYRYRPLLADWFAEQLSAPGRPPA
jgi:pimeloyl-ACP methyl ester carboxylesterase